MNEIDRQSGIGGSDIAAIVGLSPFKTRVGVYCDKLGLTPPVEVTLRMKMGKILEPVVVKLYEDETGNKVVWQDETVRHPKEPILIGTPDGALRDLPRGFESKTAGIDQAWKWGNEGDKIPQEYLIQVNWYMMLTGFSNWDVAVLIGGDDFRVFPLEGDKQLQAALLDEARKFWHDHVQARRMPELDASNAAKEYLRRQYPVGTEPARPATTSERELLAAVLSLKREKKHIDKELTTQENRLKDAIGIARGIYDDEASVRAMWSEVKETQIEAYTRAAYRRLSVTGKKEEPDAER